MLLVRVIIGIALLLVAALGPRFGLRGATRPANGVGGAGSAPPDHRRATVLILRILAALLGLWLLFFSTVELLHGHGQLPPSATHDVR